MHKKLQSQGTWIGKWTFIFTATGSAVGLGNIWGFLIKPAQKEGQLLCNLFIMHSCYRYTNNDK